MEFKRKLTTQFKKDFKKYVNNKKVLDEIDEVLKILAN
jgi:mRNA-degrading endonuclease YafQ of YafQ-DinJ toxin-antitoxin module